jgi:nucleoside 2-deoxyribosyltransferase
MRKPTIYLAGPEVFLPDAAAVGRRKQELCAAYGFESVFPLDADGDAIGPGERLDRTIYRRCEAAIRRTDVGIFNLTPFRGPSADAGTVFELGLMIGLGKPAFGYSNVAADYLSRCGERAVLAFDEGQNLWRDANAMAVEDFGNADNLMIDTGLIEHGGHPVVRRDVPAAELFYDLGGFETCLRLAAETMAKSP